MVVVITAGLLRVSFKRLELHQAREKMEAKNPLILTLRLDEGSQRFLNAMRQKHFPLERNFLKAHLTLFHQLADNEETFKIISKVERNPFEMGVFKLINLGAGVAYKVESSELESLRDELKAAFAKDLIPQDKQGYRAHITIQNKTTPEKARALMAELSLDFKPLFVDAHGLDLWEYLGGPWLHRAYYEFGHFDR